jgi:lipoate-protein ligase A
MTRGIWRYIADDGVTASFGLAADEVVTRRQGRGESPPTLRLYTYRSHCALVGRFQRIASEVNVDFCRQHGIQVNRRPTGGGAIIMGEDQLGVAIMLPAEAQARSYERTRELFLRFSSGIVGALADFGIIAGYRRKNDVEVGGKKIAGLGIYFDPAGDLLFHASVLVDLDIALMLSILRTPLEKISDKAIASVAERVTTVRREVGRAVTVQEVRERVKHAYCRSLGITLETGTFTPEELTEIAQLERERYASPEWLDREPSTPDTMGSATLKTEGGLVCAHLTLAGDIIKAIYLTGDFFADEGVLASIERALRWHASSAEALAKTLDGLREREGIALPGIPTEAVVRVITGAVEAALRREQSATPKGCFVDP